MKAEWKQKWLDALRSSKYSQAMNVLHIKGDGFCCLGVLCDIVDPSRWRNPQGEYDRTMNWMNWDGNSQHLPSSVMETVGIVRKSVDGVDHINRLMEMNDNATPFSVIADYIEEHL